ncbi:MAG TPA: hypothetical protein VM687_04105 [Stenotrophomonas sp.]|nr:hypothetical protein [Stenotrophomonas sp.]
MQRRIVLPAAWAHPSWLSPPVPPGHERALRQASVRLLCAYPELARRRPSLAAFAQGRPALARFCRLLAATWAADRVRRLIGARERDQLAAHIGRDALAHLQRQPAASFEADHSLALTDRLQLTALGLCLCRSAHSGQGLDAWYSLRLPRQVSEAMPEPPWPDRDAARACMARAVRAWRARC